MSLLLRLDGSEESLMSAARSHVSQLCTQQGHSEIKRLKFGRAKFKFEKQEWGAMTLRQKAHQGAVAAMEQHRRSGRAAHRKESAIRTATVSFRKGIEVSSRR